MDRFLIEMTDKAILDYEKSNYLVVRSMRKGKKRNIKRFVDNKKRSFNCIIHEVIKSMTKTIKNFSQIKNNSTESFNFFRKYLKLLLFCVFTV